MALGLVTFFFVEVIISANKLSDEKTAVSTNKQYEQSRLMPSISVCFKYKKAEDHFGSDDYVELVKATLNRTRYVKSTVLILFGEGQMAE